MIIRELYTTRRDGVKLYRTYSDSGLALRQVETGTVYGEAIDVDGAPYSYVETDVPLDETDVADTLAAKAAMLDELEEAYDNDD